MIRAASKYDLHATLPRNRFHYAQRAIHFVQHRPLLDVKLQVTESIAFYSGRGNFAWIEPEVLDGLSHTDPICIFAT